MDSCTDIERNTDSLCESGENMEEKEPSTNVFGEDFIIIENPEFSLQRNTALQVAEIAREYGVENSFLPPPRTLDDLPIKRRKRKNKSLRGKEIKKLIKVDHSPTEFSSNVNEKFNVDKNSECSSISNNVPQIDSHTEPNCSIEFENSQLSVSQSINNINSECDDISSKEVKENTADDNIRNVSSTCYNLRKKSVVVDYSRDILLMIDDEDFLPDKSYSCSECPVFCDSKKELKSHQVAMHGHELFPCEECGNHFTTMFGLQRHVSLKHSKAKCTKCGKQFKVGQALINHMKECGEQSASEFTQFRKPKCFPCPKCGKKFSERGNLRRHIRLHEGFRGYSCNLCGKKCTEKQALESHIRYIHSGERPYNCNVCPKSFVTISDRNRHQASHSDRRRFLCSDCGKGFKTREALKAHMKLKTGEKLWQCGVCKQRFVTKGGLKNHMVVHSDIKMYECETCQRQFSHKGSLEAHMRVHTGIMPYVCPKCGKKFAHLANKNRHVRTMHHDDS